jgi:nitroreductase
MEILQTILEHRTIRKYRSQPIPEIVLDKIIEAGTRASTTGNMQVYSIIVTRDKANREKVAPFHFNQPLVTQAPVLLTFCADFNRFNKWCKANKASPGYDNFLSFYTASIDALLVAQNVAVAAESFGLGICYLGTTTYNADKLIEFYKLPKGVIPVTTLAVGYPDEEPELTDRLPLTAVIHNEFYKDYNADDIRRLYKEKENLSLYKKLVEDNKTETLAQIFTDKRYTKKDNVAFSKSFLKVIENQGFMNNESGDF